MKNKVNLQYLFILPFLFLSFSNVSSQNLLTNSDFELGTLGEDTAPTGWTTAGTFQVDYNDPSSALNEPKGAANPDKWIDFDLIAGNNDSEDGGRAVGGRHRDILTSASLATITDTEYYTIYFEQSNPGLDVGGTGSTLWNGDGFYRFRLGGGNWVSGPAISVNGATGPLQWSTAKILVQAGAGTQLEVEARRSSTNSYMQIDNIIMVPECDQNDLGSTTLNNIYEDLMLCSPENTRTATCWGGEAHGNPTSCDIDAGDPSDPIAIPTFDCTVATAVTFDTPILPSNPNVLYHYWGNCSPLSPDMPIGISAKSNGYIQQMFCETDAFGLPAWPGGLSGDNGTIGFLPQASEDVGCDGFAQVGTCDCGGIGIANGGEKDSELIQIDFWMAVPEIQSQVGFRFSTNNREDAGSFFVGADLNNMCEVAFFTDGQFHDGLIDQLTGTYNIGDQLTGTCGLLWMRVRLYINDISDQFEVNPQINAGNGWVDIDQLLIEPATAADDNIAPTVGLASVTGYLIDGEFVYDDGGTWDPYGCNPVVLAGTDTGVCQDALYVELSEFNVTAQKESAVIDWTTLSEINSEKFIVERSGDGKSFSSIGEVQSKGNSNYKIDYVFNDTRPLMGISYYRLQELSLDGNRDYSKIVSVDFTNNSDIEIYPNPASDQLFWKNVTEDLSYKMMNMQGQEISSGLVNQSNEPLDLSTFSGGLYFMKIYNENNELTQIFKVFKN